MAVPKLGSAAFLFHERVTDVTRKGATPTFEEALEAKGPDGVGNVNGQGPLRACGTLKVRNVKGWCKGSRVKALSLDPAVKKMRQMELHIVSETSLAI